jgi:hypothetical protein
MEGECWLCDGRIKEREGANVPSLGIAVHRRCLEADLGGGGSDDHPERDKID